MIRYMFTPDGGFLAGDRERGLWGYAYPTSPHACEAERDPVKVAREIVGPCAVSATCDPVSRASTETMLNDSWARLELEGFEVSR